MGGGQGGGRLFNQAQNPGSHGVGTGSAFGLDQVGSSGGQVHRQLGLLIEGQPMGHRHRQHDLRQQDASGLGDLQHLLGAKHPACGIEAVEITDFDHGRPGRHRRREEGGIDRRHTQGQTRGLHGYLAH